MTQGPESRSGGCLCGEVRFLLSLPLRPVVHCHCGQCQRFHGSFGSYTSLPKEGLAFSRQAGLRWYDSSPGVRRGFCGSCGSSLFWERTAATAISIAAGSLDPPTGLRSAGHIYVADRGDYYAIDDGLPHHSGTWQPREAPEA